MQGRRVGSTSIHPGAECIVGVIVVVVAREGAKTVKPFIISSSVVKWHDGRRRRRGRHGRDNDILRDGRSRNCLTKILTLGQLSYVSAVLLLLISGKNQINIHQILDI